MSNDGSEPLLSGEETDALLDAMREGASGASDKKVEGLDLTAAEPRLRGALIMADKASKQLEENFWRLMLRQLGCPTTLEPSPSEITPYSVLREAIAPGSAVATLSDKDGGCGLAIVGPELVSFILDRRLGAPVSLTADNDGAPAPVRETLSNVDLRVFKLFMTELAEAFSAAWCSSAVAIQVEKLVPLDELPALPQFEPLLRIPIRVTPSGAAPADVIFSLTAPMVSTTMPEPPKLTAPPPTPSQKRQMKSRLNATDVTVAAYLGTQRSSVREILDLNVGDVLRLGGAPNEPVRVYSGGIVVMRGMPVVHHGNLAIEITETA